MAGMDGWDGWMMDVGWMGEQFWQVKGDGFRVWGLGQGGGRILEGF